MSTTDQYKNCNLVCLKGLGEGAEKKTDVVVAGRRADATEHVLFFGGDVQDYPEEMMSHRDNGQYVRWNSLATAALLCRRFPSAMVMVIKPHHMHLKTFSVYSQFVESSDFGCPTHSANYGACQRLLEIQDRGLMGIPPLVDRRQVMVKQHIPRAVQTAVPRLPVTDPPKVPVHLIGFSKGCIVLNQLIFELGHVKEDKSLSTFLSQVHAMTWLDGGHNGGSNTWVTDPQVLQQLAALSVDVTVHVTPYQVKDSMRKWIGKEKKKFVELLVKAGAKVSDNLHFDDLPVSIDNHFRVLEVF
ncbi:hypothetical protein BaRGS_00009358 [Batillaria attramentaria]|uniref:Uncharacterized protein n=1 Tax=Batillaria attramentaria TaxID=370345 RepID=A0ABD0LJU9_9CAEN